jgi:hypothetical protein
LAEGCIGSYPLSVIASSHTSRNDNASHGQFLTLTIELQIDNAPWIGAAPLSVGQKDR